MAVVLRKGKAPKPVLNLGWLHRNWSKNGGIEYLGFTRVLPAGDSLPQFDFCAVFKDGTFFSERYADLAVFLRYIDRPIFRGLSIRFIDQSARARTMTRGQGETVAAGVVGDNFNSLLTTF